MLYGVKIPPDPKDFKPPHTWATYIPTRTTVGIFKTHSNFGAAKSAVWSSMSSWRGNWQGAWIYTWNSADEEWVLTHYLPSSDRNDPDALALRATKTPTKRPIKGPSDKQVEEALASIAKAGQP